VTVREGAKDTAIALGSRLAVLAIGVGIQSALARLLGPDGRGSYAVCLLFATLLGIIFTFGVDRAGQYYAASGRMGRSEAITSSLVLLVAGAVIAMLVGRAIMLFHFTFLEKADRSSFLISLGVVPFVGLTNAFAVYFIGLRRFKWMAVAEITNVAAQLVATLILVLGLGLGVNGALVAIVAAGVVNTAVCLWLLHKEGALGRLASTAAGYLRLLSYGARFIVAKLNNVFSFRVGTLILAFFVSPSEIGLFAAAAALVMRITVIPKAVETAVFTRVAEKTGGRPKLVAQACRVSAIVTGLALLALAAVSIPLVRLLLSAEFLGAVPLIWILILGVFARSATMALTAYFTGTDRPAICSLSVGIGTAINVVLLFVLIPVIGLAGAAWAMTAGYVASAIIFIIYFRQASGQTLRETWALRREDFILLRSLPRYVREMSQRKPPMSDNEGVA
jgi:O-antigen/teichoic acid export membrane protein